MVKKIFLLLATVALAGCASQEKNVKPDLPVVPGELAIYNIPKDFLNGVFAVQGRNETGETIKDSAKTWNRITEIPLHVKLYNKDGAIQQQFTGSGAYTVTVSLFRYPETTVRETRIFVCGFADGGASVDWNDGIVSGTHLQ
jgi:hypothetical protein